MKILVAYFSQTGNTEKIAKAILEEASLSHEAAMRKIEEVDPGGLSDYDIVFLGGPIHGGGLAAPLKGLLDQLPASPSYVLAAFITHAAEAYRRENFEKGISYIENIARDRGIRYGGCFDCTGKLDPALWSMVQKMQKLSDKEWEELMARVGPHPDAEDEKNARAFVRKVLAP
ncbi:MAG: flavodoxin domain-containing protein [Deltaproteobacteria bacterium]|nr:flavodoxin domain-containing protein [Deltaproteobacteria bacterium]